jgi:hypothetical protein
MRRISMTTRDELVAAIAARYAQGDRIERGRILDEFAAVTGFHRKHAMRLLRAGQPNRRSGPRPGRRVYDDAVREALIVVWEASDRVCGKRLRPLVPILVEAMERHGHLRLAQEVRISLLAMSAATIDRALRDVRRRAGKAPRRRAAPSTAVRRSVPVRTFDGWDDPPPGFVEADLVAHSGPVAKGSFVQTLVLTDIATGWTECAPLLVREQRLLTEVLSELRKVLPFTLLGLDTDNDSVFMNETVRDYCEKGGVEFTRCRPYRKNDQAWVEQKNGAVVRRTVGYRRFEGLEAAAVLARLYAAMRLFVNFFQPSFKLAAKARDGAKVRKRYHPPATPCQRLLADTRTSQEVRPAERAAPPPWTRFVYCGRFVQPSSSSSKLPTPRPPAMWRSLPRRRWSSSFLGCARHGRRVKYARPARQGRSPSVCGAGPIRWQRSRPSCGGGSRQSPGAHRANCSSGCRQSIPASTRTDS